MVYVDPKNLRYAPYWQRWILTRPEGEHTILNVILLCFFADSIIYYYLLFSYTLQDFYEKVVVQAIAFILEGVDGTSQGNPLKMVIPQTELNMLMQLCHMYDALLPVYTNVDDIAMEAPEAIIYDQDSIECGFLQVYTEIFICLICKNIYSTKYIGQN